MSKVPVSLRAVRQRIDRALKPQGKLYVIKSRRRPASGCVVNLDSNTVEVADILMEELARSLKVLRPWENMNEL